MSVNDVGLAVSNSISLLKIFQRHRSRKLSRNFIILTNPPATLLNTWITSMPAFRHAMTASAAESPAPTISTGFALIFSSTFTFSIELSSSGSSYFSHDSDLFSPRTPSRLTRSLPPFAKTTLLAAMRKGFFVDLSNLHEIETGETNLF